jgi:hypothetical protein
MPANPFLTLQVRGKKEILMLRRKARQVANLLRYEPYEQTCIAAGAFAVAYQAWAQLGQARICFQIEQEQLHIYVQEIVDERAPRKPAGPEEAAPGKTLLRLARPLPREKGLAEVDVAWLVQHLEGAAGSLFDEVVKQNQEVLSLLHELQLCRDYLQPKEEAPKSPSAA